MVAEVRTVCLDSFFRSKSVFRKVSTSVCFSFVKLVVLSMI